MDGQPYRMKFGKHKGQTLQEVPPSYLSWLIEKEVYAGKEDLKAALIQGKYLPSAAGPESSPSSPTRDRQVSDNEEAAPGKLADRKLATNNSTMSNENGSAHVLNFGKYAGQRLSDVPSHYISWLITTGVHEKRSDLAAALQEAGLLVEIHRSTDTMDPAWRAPNVYATTDRRFYDPMSHTPRWISDVDIAHYFRLGEPLLSRAGVRLVSEAEFRRVMEYSILVPVSKSPKRWLYQVYECARHIAAVSGDRSGRDMAEEALTRLLDKNRRRELEIMGMMGLGECCD